MFGFDLVKLILPSVNKLLDGIIPDKNKAAELNIQLQQIILDAQTKANEYYTREIEAKSAVIQAEMNQGKWYTQWRAFLMLGCTGMILFNWVVVPILNCLLYFLGTQIDPTPIPGEVWAVLSIGLGGYLGKETIQTYSQNKYSTFNYELFYSIVREELYKKGLPQEHVNVLDRAIRLALSNTK